MTIDSWLCPACHSVNGRAADRCYSCRAARPADPPPENGGAAADAPVPGGVTGPEARTVSRGPSAPILVALLVAVGVMGGLLAVAIRGSLPADAGNGAAELFPGAELVTPSPIAFAKTPSPAPTTTVVAPSPSPTPEPAWLPDTGRFAGTWLVAVAPDQATTAAGAYLANFLLKVRPTCTTGSCAVTAELVDAHSGKRLASKDVTLTAEGYRFKIAATVGDLCRGRTGLTVEDGANRTTSLVLRPFVSPGGSRSTLAIERSVRLNPTKRDRPR